MNITKLVLKIFKSYGYDFYNRFIENMYRNAITNSKISYIINNIDKDPIYDLYKENLNSCVITNSDFKLGQERLGVCRWNPFIFCSDLWSLIMSCSDGYGYIDINKLLWNNEILYHIIYDDYHKIN